MVTSVVESVQEALSFCFRLLKTDIPSGVIFQTLHLNYVVGHTVDRVSSIYGRVVFSIWVEALECLNCPEAWSALQ